MNDEGKHTNNRRKLRAELPKLARGDQLGVGYSEISQPEPGKIAVSHTSGRLNVLFVCSKNQWRSPTAEAVWRGHPQLNVRSGGTSPNARHHVSVEDIRWSDVILVMEEKHKSRLKAEYTRVLDAKPIHVLDIPDDYKYMDAELVAQLRQTVPSILMVE